ncbi:MAG: PAS domain S-box protein [Dongiaceae bacterium]
MFNPTSEPVSLDYQALFESAPDLYLLLTPGFFIINASEAYLRATMTKREEVIGRHIFDVFPDNPNDPTATGMHDLTASLERVLKKRAADAMGVQKYDIRKPESEGGAFEERYWSPINVPVFGKNNKIIAILHRVEDITEFVKLKYQGQEQIKENKILRDRTEEMEIEIYRRSRQIFEANKKLEAANQELENLNETIRQSSEARLKAVVDHAVDGLITINAKGVIDSFNPACERIFGYQAGEVMGKNIKVLMPEPYHSEHDGYIANYHKTGKPKIIGTAGREVKAKRKDGSVFPMDLSISSFRVNGQEYFSGIIRDITQRKAAEAELARYTKKLEISNQELDDFAYIASHDLKEPLRGLFNQATFLIEDYAERLDGEGKRRLTRLAELVQRMERLINDLLYFSRLGRAELAIQETDPNAVVAEIGQMLESFLKEKHARIVIPRPMPRVICDKPRITEVFRNLITNAVKYNDKPERLVEIGFLESIAAPQGREDNVFYVKDNGIGIEPQFFDEVFRIFRRLQQDEGKEGGTGVGLTFVKKIIQRHQGRIWLESEKGKGTTFYFTLERKES